MSDQVDDPWPAAERAADLHRYERLHPTRRRVIAERWLPPVMVLLLLVECIGLLSALAMPVDIRDTVRLGIGVLMLLSLALGFVWGLQTGRLSIAGTPSIRAALPPGTWPSIRRQIAGRAPADRDHLEIITELARQQRGQTQGQFGLFSWYLPFYLGFGIDRHLTLGAIWLVIGLALIAFGLIVGAVNNRRITRFLRSEDAVTATS